MRVIHGQKKIKKNLLPGDHTTKMGSGSKYRYRKYLQSIIQKKLKYVK